jgi:hypothetical protein
MLLAFIDDHSRLLVGWRWGTGADVFRLEAALRAGMMTRGEPRRRSWLSAADVRFLAAAEGVRCFGRES